jgi:hypothetical protein
VDGDVAHMGKMRNTYTSLVWKTKRKRPLGRLRRGWDNIETNLKKV